MGTRSRIAIRNTDNTYTSVYCHWDGYPSHHGPILQHYDTEEKVRALLALGNLSALRKEIGVMHDFDARVSDMTTAYSRDRGDAGQESNTSSDLDALFALTQDTGGEWLYIFTPDGWQCAKGGVSAFGLPASSLPGNLRSVDYWLQREAFDK